MNINPLVSVVIPVYNIEKYIKNTLISVINQDYKNIEIIVIDDGSADNSYQVCQNLANQDKRVKLYCQSNKGVSAARNLGILHSKGEFITFVDGDDIVSSSLISIMTNVIQKCQTDMVSVNYSRNIYELNSNIVFKPIILTKFEALLKLPDNKLISYSACGKLYKTQIVKDNLFDENTGMLEDYLFVCNYISKTKRLAIIKNILYCYIVRNNSALHSKYINKIDEVLYSYKKSINIINKENSQLLPYYYCAFFYELINIKHICLKNNVNVNVLNSIDKEINFLKSLYIKGNNKKRVRIIIFKLNNYLYFKLIDLYELIICLILKFRYLLKRN